MGRLADGRAGAVSAGNPVRIESLEVNEADDGLVVYDPARDMVHHLNPSAAVIFDLCDGTLDPAAIAGVLEQAYDLESPPLDDALTGLRDLAERELIRWDGQEGAG
jgi:Coenzyme PQQ synthesis protein D (PqqD)